MTFWQPGAQFGFLASRDAQDIWEALSDALAPDLQPMLRQLREQQPLRQIIDAYDWDAPQPCVPLDRHDNALRDEALFMLLGYLASAIVGGGQTTLPRRITVPFAALCERLQRPPMLSYAGMVLNNWQLQDATQGFAPDNIQLLFRITDLVDERWFFQVHIAIEAQAGPMLQALVDVETAIEAQDNHRIQDHLRTMQRGLVRITRTFHEMPALCDPDIYFQDVRPYLMSFGADVTYAGVTPNPTPLRGGSGAQSSIVPAMLAGLGIDHRQSELTTSLADMQRYMPAPHREFIAAREASQLRAYCAAQPPLRDAYNHVLRQLITFRRAHLYYARTYIFEKSTNPTGTGGTEYMSFLSKLIDETAEQLL